jgi:hypothetical protein
MIVLVEVARVEEVRGRLVGEGMVRSGGAGGMETWRFEDLETRRSGDLKDRCRCDDMAIWRSGGTQQVCRHGGMEVWRVTVGIATWRHGGLEV